jgi:hypothetical protein
MEDPPEFVVRARARRAAKAAELGLVAKWSKKLGYVVNTGPELEFFLFRRGADGKIAPLPHDQAGYFDFSTDLAQEIRQDMVDALEGFGIRVEAAHHEVAVGQHEIDFEYSDALRTADNAVTFKFALKAIAQKHGLYATFMPKPIFGINGSGMHTHQSLFSGEKNAFFDSDNEYYLSDEAQAFIAAGRGVTVAHDLNVLIEPRRIAVAPRGVPPAVLVTSESALILALQTPGSGEAFYRDASDPVTDASAWSKPADVPRLRAAAERHPDSIQIVGSPPFEDVR